MKKMILLLLMTGLFIPVNASINTFTLNIRNSNINYLDNPATLKGNVAVKSPDSNSDAAAVQNAVLTLTAAENSSIVFSTISDENGNFIFDNLPAGTYNLKAEAAGLPSVVREIKVESGAVLSVEIILSVEISEQVTVRDEEGLLSSSETTVSNIIRAETIKNQPFRDDEYQNALPLTPGVIKDSANNTFVKGARAGQSRLTVNGADITDPVSGNPVFEIPLEAVNNIKVEENPFSSEFGQFTGGYTQLQSKGGGEKFDYKVARFFPTFGGFFSGKIESFRPRVTVSGPIIRNKLFFLQSFEYRLRREINPDLPDGADAKIIERVTSFTQIDYTVNESNRLKINFALFPQKTKFANINFFNPKNSTYNLKQRGYLISLNEQAVLKTRRS